MDSTHDDTRFEPVSPELVLVDPELAERARLALPDPETGFVWRSAEHSSPLGLAPAAPSELRSDATDPQPWLARARASAAASAEHRVEEQPSRPRRPRVAAALAAILAVNVVGAFALRFSDDADTTADPEIPVQSSPLPSAVAEVNSGYRPDTRTTLGRATSLSKASRTFIWVRVRRATHYRVTFRRGSSKVFEAWPSRPRLVIPVNARYHGRRVRFTRGRYMWFVRPGFGPRSRARYGAPIVESTWIIP